MLSRRRTMSLGNIIVATMILVTILPNMVFGILSARLIENSLMSEAERSSVLIAAALSEKMTLSVKEAFNELSDIRGRILASRDPVGALQAALSSQAGADLFRRVELTNAEGRVVAEWPPSPGRHNADLSGRHYAERLKAGEGYYLSSRYISYENGSPVIDLVIPSGNGLLIGTLEVGIITNYFGAQKNDRIQSLEFWTEAELGWPARTWIW